MGYVLPPVNWTPGMPVEIWADIPGFDGYQVNNYGEVRSLDRWIEKRSRAGNTYRCPHAGRILQLNRVPDGYLSVNLGSGGKQAVSKYVYRLVLLAFAGPRPEGLICLHGPQRNPDGISCDWLCNLSYGPSAKNNDEDRKRDGTVSQGERNPGAKLTGDDVREIRRLWESELHLPRKGNHGRKWTGPVLAEKFSVGTTAISHALRGKTWSHIR